jgi:nucleoside-diphosphate-sugar epimerase
MKVFLTGGTGYIGGSFIKKLVETGHEVVALYHHQLPDLQDKALTWVQGSLSDVKSLVAAMQDCEQVYHMAGLARIAHKKKNAFFEVNVTGTENILKAMTIVGLSKLVFTSTAGVFGRAVHSPLQESDPVPDPLTDDYSVTKLLAEQKVLEASKKGLHGVIVNPPRVYGPGKSTASSPVNKVILDYIRKPFYFIPGHGRYYGNYAFMDDILNGHLMAMEKGRPGERYILGGHNHDYLEFFSILEKVTKLKRRRIAIPRWSLTAVTTAAGYWSFLSGTTPKITNAVVKKLFSNQLLSCNKAIQELGYKITPLETGIELTLASLQNHRP